MLAITASGSNSLQQMYTVDTRVPVLDGTLTLAIKIWYPSSTSKDSASSAKRRCCLAYPGWLDNVGSFENIAPLLCEGYDMVFAVIELVSNLAFATKTNHITLVHRVVDGPNIVRSKRSITISRNLR